MRKILTVAGLAAALPLAAQAAHVPYVADLTQLNNSGVSGTADLRLLDNMLEVTINATGLTPDMLHLQHIHGRRDENGNPIDSVNPPNTPPENDPDGIFDDDEFVELEEGLPFYGGIRLFLNDGNGLGDPDMDELDIDFPTAPGGVIDNFTNTYDLSDPFFAGIADNLELHEIVIHGLFVGEDAEGLDGVMDGYSATLPVASGVIRLASVAAPAPIPLPAAGWALLAGLGGLGAFRLRRKG
jgi:hypothetical protein